LTPQPASVAATMTTATSAAMRLKPWRSMSLLLEVEGESSAPLTRIEVVTNCGAR
jgi:hypothetical protein